MTFPERFSGLPEYAFPRLRGLLDAHAPGGEVVHMTIGEPKHAFPDFVGEIIAESDGRRAAAFESLSLCVDLEARKSAEYPDWAQARMQAMMAAQADVPRPKELGQTIGIRRK